MCQRWGGHKYLVGGRINLSTAVVTEEGRANPFGDNPTRSSDEEKGLNTQSRAHTHAGWWANILNWVVMGWFCCWWSISSGTIHEKKYTTRVLGNEAYDNLWVLFALGVVYYMASVEVLLFPPNKHDQHHQQQPHHIAVVVCVLFSCYTINGTFFVHSSSLCMVLVSCLVRRDGYFINNHHRFPAFIGFARLPQQWVSGWWIHSGGAFLLNDYTSRILIHWSMDPEKQINLLGFRETGRFTSANKRITDSVSTHHHWV